MAEYRYNTKHYCGQRLSLTSPVQKGGIAAICPNCNKRAWLERVKGEFNPDHPCDSRCTGAYGNKCVCACGGANHGRDHGITQVVAVERDPGYSNQMQVVKPREGQFLGEVGSYITGEVSVRANHTISGDRSLVTFRTNDGDGIKWFVPDYAAPDWEIGKKLTIRAKVKRHETHPDFGKSTIVTYVEEIV